VKLAEAQVVEPDGSIHALSVRVEDLYLFQLKKPMSTTSLLLTTALLKVTLIVAGVIFVISSFFLIVALISFITADHQLKKEKNSHEIL